MNYHNQYYSAFGDNTKSENLAKKLWLSKLDHFSSETICGAAEKIIAESEYLPTLHKMLSACRQVGMPAGLANPRKAYQEACNKRSPKAQQQWSHPAVYLTGRDAGWHMLANEIESKALPAFTEIFGTKKNLHAVYVGPFLERDDIESNIELIQKVSESTKGEISSWKL